MSLTWGERGNAHPQHLAVVRGGSGRFRSRISSGEREMDTPQRTAEMEDEMVESAAAHPLEIRDGAPDAVIRQRSAPGPPNVDKEILKIADYIRVRSHRLLKLPAWGFLHFLEYGRLFAGLRCIRV